MIARGARLGRGARSGAPLLTLYRWATQIAAPVAPALLAARAARGKEDPTRRGERLGFPSLARPAGSLVWLHGASIGESLALAPLVTRLTARGLTLLLTTGTPSAAQLVTQRMRGALHQYIPLDAPVFMRRFFDHWRPDLLVLAESEFWPNLLAEARLRGAPVVVVNGRVSQRTCERWARAPRTAQALFGGIDLALAQSRADADRLARLGVRRLHVTGALKFDAPSPPVESEAFGALAGAIGARPIWTAASTHPGEEALCLDAHARLAARFPDLLTLIAPLDPRRGAALAALARRRGFCVARRGAGETPTRATQVYIADAYGEMGLWYGLASVAFLGGSLNGGRGQNPIEPIRLGAAVLHGPSVSAFADIYEALDDAGGALEVRDAATLAPALDALLSDGAARRAMARAAQATAERMSGATDKTMAALAPYIARLGVGRGPDAGA